MGGNCVSDWEEGRSDAHQEMLCTRQPGSAHRSGTNSVLGFSALPLGSGERGQLCHGAGMLWELPKLLWKAAGFGSPRPALCSTLHPRNASSGVGSAGIAGIVHSGVAWWIWLWQAAAAASCAVNEIPSPLFSWNYSFCHGKILESRGLFCSPRHTAFASTLGNGKGGCRQQQGPCLEGR